MTRYGLAAAMWLVVTAAVGAELKVESVQAANGPFGPARPHWDFYPHDELYLRFVVSGVRVDLEGKTDVELTLRVSDAQGKVALEREQKLQGVLMLGGGTFTSYARLAFADPLPEGVYTVTVIVQDRLGKDVTTFERKLIARGPAFAIVAPQFFYDPEGRVPAPAGGVVGQTVFFRLRVIGFDRSQDKVDAEMSVQVLDADGKEILPRPITASVRSDDAQAVKRSTHLNFTGDVPLSRPGNFTLRITVTDKLGQKTTTLETPLRVHAP
jgi:hypothetical protein